MCLRPTVPLARLAASLLVLFAVGSFAAADGPEDNHPESVRRVPKLGIEVPAEQRRQIEAGLERLKADVAALRKRDDPSIVDLLPDVEIYSRAVSDAIEFQEFFAPRDVNTALELLEEGQARARQLAEGVAPWTTDTGLVVRGYRSKIDDSVQPYGLVIPPNYNPGGRRARLDLWFHGRGETLSEVSFLGQRRSQEGQFAPADTIVLHPYGRYSNAFKFAGEVDVLEALDSVRARYAIDDDRISVRGFSMGGAACWQFAVHYADRWFAANPGAGFAETPEFLRFFQKEDLHPTWYERKLWHMYDCTDWARNLYQCPTVAYSGEDDIQKQAADIMEVTLEREGIDLVHIIGPGTKHAYHPDAKLSVARRLDSLAEHGRQRIPRTVHLVTYTLKYNSMAWVTVDGIGEHWERASVDAELSAGRSGVRLDTANVTDLTLHMPPGWCPLDVMRPVRVAIDGQQIEAPRPKSDRSWKVKLHRASEGWHLGARSATGLVKRHDLQGPIDDAFMNSFLFVRPTGTAQHAEVGLWAEAELERAIEHWRRHFRGHARVKDDREIDEREIASANLILWGDPGSNSVLRKIADRLPIAWGRDAVVIAGQRFDAAHHAPVMIYPNPLNPSRYVVLNSSFTYREYAYLNNARQVPKLPDWAVVDLRTPPDSLWPGKIVAADFFDERWQLKPAHD